MKTAYEEKFKSIYGKYPTTNELEYFRKHFGKQDKIEREAELKEATILKARRLKKPKYV